MNQNNSLINSLGLGAVYNPASDWGIRLNTEVPDSMEQETHNALFNIEEAVGGSVDNYVRERLGYQYPKDLKKALSAEQIDAVAMAIYNIEVRRQGMIIGDQTGIGKGRVSAAMIRYGVTQGHKPIFLTEKPNLFSDLFRDLIAIGSENLVPFIVNAKDSKTIIKDEDGAVLHEPLTPTEQESIFKSKTVPDRFDFVMATYTQFNSILKKPTKPEFLMEIAKDNVLVLDESHNASGGSNTGVFLQDVLANAKGVTFLSATFAKRPDNMPLYAAKTCIRDSAMSKEDLVEAIQKGGVALQEIVSSQLVKYGQMLRRERSYEGVEVNYITLTELEQKHRQAADNITSIIRRIIRFQKEHVRPVVDALDEIAAADGEQVNERKGTNSAGVDNQPYFSRVFMVINQMLFSIKCEAVADRAIERLRQGKKPVIAFSSTMGTFLEDLLADDSRAPGEDLIDGDFRAVLMRGLEGVMKITTIGPNGDRVKSTLPLEEFGERARAEYAAILHEIKNVSTGLCISPIDVVINKIEAAGYTVAEVTGRRLALQLVGGKPTKAQLNGFEAGEHYFEFIPEANAHIYKGASEVKDLIARVKPFVEQQVGNYFPNTDTGWDIEFRASSCQKWFSARLGDKKLKAFTALEDIIKVGIRLSTERLNGNTKGFMHRFISIVRIEGKVYPFLFNVKEMEGHFVYHAILVPEEIEGTEKPSGLEGFAPTGSQAAFLHHWQLDNPLAEAKIGMDGQNCYTLSGFEDAETEVMEERHVQTGKRSMPARLVARKRPPTNDAFRMFNNNEVDVLMINQSGSTGASAHAIPTNKVPASEVKQRVMIVLQAELDINTEVQKRGRINRTGQIMKPIYDYITSAIPAESRLMMMLQKKLKSLDANTASNQKQSKSILEVPDFLNKIGDKVVFDFLGENPDLMEELDDPLNQKENPSGSGNKKGDDDDDSPKSALEGAAAKVSGRIAVTDTNTQQRFYEEIAARYNDEVAYLKETGEYDLEVEVMDLQAETIKTSIPIYGKGGESPFGDNSILNEVLINSQRKPMTAEEVSDEIHKFLNGATPDEFIETTIGNIHGHYTQERANAEAKRDEEYREKLADFVNTRAFDKLLNKHSTRDAAYAEAVQINKEARKKETAKFEMISNTRQILISKVIKFMRVGRIVAWPVVTENGLGSVSAVVLGIYIDTKRPNPYTPSAIKLRIAIAGSQRSILIPLSKIALIDGIISNSFTSNKLFEKDIHGQEWDDDCRAASADRVRRYIITGNILQAFKGNGGRLISYTLKGGGTEKGILLTEGYSPDGGGEKAPMVSIPLRYGERFVRNIPQGAMIRASNGVSFKGEASFSQYVTVLAPSSSRHIYTDGELLSFLSDGKFTQISGSYRGFVAKSSLPEFLKVLDDRHPSTIEIEAHRITPEMAEYLEQAQRGTATNQKWKPAKAPAQAPQETPPQLAPIESDLALAQAQFDFDADAMQMEIDLIELEEDSLSGTVPFPDIHLLHSNPLFN